MTTAAKIIPLNQPINACADCANLDFCPIRDTSKSLQSQLADKMQKGRTLQRDQQLFRAGDAARYVYFVRSGSFKQTVSTSDGVEQIVRFCLPGDVIGLENIADDSHSNCTVALETSSVCRLNRQQLQALCAGDQELQQKLFDLVGKELVEQQTWMLQLAQRTASERLAAFLLRLSEQQAHRGFSGNEFNLSMSRQDIANYLALAVETVSRLLTTFQNQGVLNIDRRRIRIDNREALEAATLQPLVKQVA